MLRHLHRWPGLLAALLVFVLALSGAALSLYPALERLAVPQAASTLTVADLAARVASAHPGLEQIRRAPSGRVVAWWFEGGRPGAAVIDPATGADLGSPDPLPGSRVLTDLHRELFAGDTGRLVAAAGAALMLALAISGLWLVARRMGGWNRWFGRSRGPFAGRLHVELARFAVGGLILSSVTALWMTASMFSLLPDGAAEPAPALAAANLPRLAYDQIPALANTPAHALRELSLPSPDDPTDTFKLVTEGGVALIDPGTGAMLSSATPGFFEKATEIMVMLHTGQGASVLGLLLGLMSLSVPALALSGAQHWWAGLRATRRIRRNARAQLAETVVLVASEGGTTWGFARTLHNGLTAAGQKVHTAPLATFDPARYPQARRFLILAATYGEGEAPTAAKGVLDRIAALTSAPTAPLAILGFGDRSFPQFCGFAESLRAVAARIGWTDLLPMATVDRQSAQDFARWSRDLGAVLSLPLDLTHLPERPKTSTLTLISRRDHGAEVQAPTSILRFALPRPTLWQRLTGQGLARFEAGDLIGILPRGSDLPRFYSLASSAQDGFLEICVRRHPGGLCSGQLTDLAPGATIAGFGRRNPGFRPQKGRKPVILIGAGTGVAPLAGFIRANRRHQPMQLYFGARAPQSDLLYEAELRDWQAAGQLTRLTTAFSRHGPKTYVQDALRADASELARLIGAGAQIMVCGGRDMAGAVRAALAEILSTIGQTPASLKAEGRYAEDVY
ncbi:PepSY domain-containing protein [Rhodobacter capsulatus]|uniref:PepSY domain-containing protein n=1 Tax=Rhodobacter capsulatus TaxID=1061 RepID=UPI0006DC7239|nr:PepSY domain-containing protein [Rhodobacter capsulatus]KQB12910.1 N-acetylglucosamine transferase [Rhodobacter capsulatus]KQB13043.1 N-acetylglucosamine transferase [Rhodobacter capsulatus]PZX28487.1 sulfite reductase (NADPH) flavoprotein alpha-component [Rhodobacter capsulatus]QNR62765.1 PepSY domain-containing protein [Rhodobacter capsulatus]